MKDVKDSTSHPLPIEVQAGGSRSSISKVQRSGVDDVDLVTLCKHNQELQADSENLFSRRIGDKTMKTDKLLKLCFEKNGTPALWSEGKRLPELREGETLRAEKVSSAKQTTEDTVAAKVVAGRRLLEFSREI